MKYYFSKVLSNTDMEKAQERITAALKEEGFGVLTEIDMSATLHKKLGVEMPPYKILGACNPQYAYKAVQAEDKIGLMLPCNVILQQKGQDVEVSAIDPVASMQAIENDALGETATAVREKLQRVIEGL
ncbi:MAG TPA: DUF302 domain-containing protein [Phaeodactylibacter sp.]|nr:DUF302 domain-containing protein [Phaeodactylibacter sp.]